MPKTASEKTIAPLESPKLGEPYLLTPGPLTTAYCVKEAMLRDWGSWDGDFRAMTADLRRQLLDIASDTKGEFDCVPMQGSGSFSVEAMLGSFVPRDGKVLVLSNGAYGKRIAQTLSYLGRDHVTIDKGDYMPPRGPEVAAALDGDPAITHVVVVHCETSSGILNPLKEISDTVYAHGRKLLVDSMSAFGAVPAGLSDFRYEAIVSSANKCIEGVPGFGFVIARKSELEACKGRSHSLSLDIHAQWDYMNKTGQWRFTPPTHVVAALVEALQQYQAEGGQPARGARYAANRERLVQGLQALGLRPLLDAALQSPIIVTFHAPAHPQWSFPAFYEGVRQRGFILYPGKLTQVETFRVGCIGAITPEDVDQVVHAIGATLRQLGLLPGACAA
jgi:2-aminoethylphosphonate-pyruvate transaminase